ncbi:MAG: hypothetical protein ACYDAO_10005 [Thermoplasmataceae archaeon]
MFSEIPTYREFIEIHNYGFSKSLKQYRYIGGHIGSQKGLKIYQDVKKTKPEISEKMKKVKRGEKQKTIISISSRQISKKSSFIYSRMIYGNQKVFKSLFRRNFNKLEKYFKNIKKPLFKYYLAIVFEYPIGDVTENIVGMQTLIELKYDIIEFISRNFRGNRDAEYCIFSIENQRYLNDF